MTELFAPAKLTRYLEITGRRANGYHDLRSEMVSLDFGDVLTIDEGEDFLRVRGNDLIPIDGTNLVARALALTNRRAGVTIEKNIPAGGGLGGGSADAAAILRWAGGVSNEEALQLGGDVPFCQIGGRALVEGVGEVVTPLTYEHLEVTLFVVGYGVPTPLVYAAYDELAREGYRFEGQNHLEEPARRVDERVGESLDFLRSEFGDVQLAGSGATMFVTGHVGENRTDVQSPAGLIQIYHATTTPANER
jgi:4-diphosphocytidyl-2-C-methyl-D-erythritol kinase